MGGKWPIEGGAGWVGNIEALEVTAEGEAELNEDTEVELGLLSGVFRFSLEAKGWLTLTSWGVNLACLGLELGSSSLECSVLGLLGGLSLKLGLLLAGELFEFLAKALELPNMLDSILLQA